MKTSGRKHQEKRKQTFSNVVEIERKLIGYILWRQKYDVVIQILNQKVHVKYCLKRQVFKSNFKLQSFFIACITPVILFIWDLIRSVNIPGHVALLLFVGLVSETAPPVSPRDSQNIGFSLHALCPAKKHLKIILAFQKNCFAALLFCSSFWFDLSLIYCAIAHGRPSYQLPART